MKNRKALRIAAICFLGSVIGAAVGLEIKTISLLFGIVVGTLVGGITGWLIYEPKRTWQGLKYGWETARRMKRWEMNEQTKEGFRSLGRKGVISLIYSTFLTLNFIIFFIGTAAGNLFNFFMILVIALVITNAMGFAMVTAENERITAEERKKIVDFAKKYINPLMVYGYWIPKGIWRIFSLMPKLMPKAICGFGILMMLLGLCLAYLIKNFILYTHSDEHLVVLIDSGIGAGIGVVMGNPLIGGMVGAGAGFANFLLVTPRAARYFTKNRQSNPI